MPDEIQEIPEKLLPENLSAWAKRQGEIESRFRDTWPRSGPSWSFHNGQATAYQQMATYIDSGGAN